MGLPFSETEFSILSINYIISLQIIEKLQVNKKQILCHVCEMPLGANSMDFEGDIQVSLCLIWLTFMRLNTAENQSQTTLFKMIINV